MKKSRLHTNLELQALVHFVVALFHQDEGMIRVLGALNMSDFCFERSAVLLGMKAATLRQRLHRFQKRLEAVLGDRFAIPIRRRAKVSYEADDRAYRVAAAAEVPESDVTLDGTGEVVE